MVHDSNSVRETPDWRMIDCKVPILISLWSGTGTEMVPSDSFFCIIIWLPRLRISKKPWLARTAHTSFPERTRSLPNGNLDLCHKNIPMEPLLYFFWRSCFEKQFQCFLKVITCLLNGISLASNIQFRTKRYVSVPLFLYDCRKSM